MHVFMNTFITVSYKDYTSLLQNRTHMQNKKGRKQSTVHFGAQINKHQQALKTVAQ